MRPQWKQDAFSKNTLCYTVNHPHGEVSILDSRAPLGEGAVLLLGGRTYTIQKQIGRGATSIVYSARYSDSLSREKSHSVLIKELFPLHPKGLIVRNEQGGIAVAPEAETFFELHKRSFVKGNSAHIDLHNACPELTGVNIDSYEEGGTVYTILGNLSGETLQSFMRENRGRITLSTVVRWMLSLLDALEVFHKNNLLHLDISPDNILLLSPEAGKSEKHRRLFLIDYNSVWSVDEPFGANELYYSMKESYCAPEVRLRERRSISYASDLFSLCAVFYELVQGKPLNFSNLYTGAQSIDQKSELLKDATPQIKTKIAQILRQGLKLPPKRRYQSIDELRRELSELERLVYGDDVLRKAVRLFRKHTVAVVAVTLVLAFALSFAAIAAHERFRGYPVTTQEKYVTDNAMTALAVSLDKLGRQIGNDLSALRAYGEGYERFLKASQENEPINAACILSQSYQASSLDAFRAGASPLPFDLLLELLNAPDDYRAWSDRMLASLRLILPDSRYPEADRDAIVELYMQYIDAYADAYYLKAELILLPLNEDGRKELLKMLPYMPVFGDMFVAQPFGGDQTELESRLRTAENALQDAKAQLLSYGVDVE